MELTPDEARQAGLAANLADRSAEAYRLLLPIAEAGDAEVQGIVGSLMMGGMHRADGPEPLDEATAQAEQEQAGRFLQAASDAGIGPASFNLATLIVMGYGGGSWEERRARATGLYALAQAQGFTAFGSLMQGAGPGQPYFGILEEHAASTGCPLPGERDPAA